jgi:hypothetical protein
MTNKYVRSIFCLLAVMLLVASTGQAQVTTATVYGRVLDPTGAVVPNAAVTASSQSTGAEFNTVSSSAGEFTISFLPAGTYTLTIASEGFKTYQETDLTLASGQRHSTNFSLDIGVTTETVTVTSSAPLMNTVNAEQDISLNTNQVAELPMINRDITGILTLGTGASLTDGGWTLSINGLAPRGFTMTVDAVDAVPDAEFAGLSLYQNFNFIKGISVEAVQEVETSKNIFSAEVGHTIAGNVNLISKSGSNQLHGSLFEMYQSGGLHANNFLVGTKAPLVYHQFGGSIGGPIVKDKLFFFGVYEGYRFGGKTPVPGQTWSRGMRQRILDSIPGSQAYLDLWPEPTEADGPPIAETDSRFDSLCGGADFLAIAGGQPCLESTAFFGGQGDERRVDDHFVGKIDWNPTNTDFLTFRYVGGTPLRSIPRTILGNGRQWDGINQNGSFSWIKIISPTFTSETRWGTNVNAINRLDVAFAANKVPFIRGFGNPSEPGAEVFAKDGHTSTLTQNFSKTAGKHSIKFGFMYRYMSGTRVNEEVPVYTYETQADLLAANITSARFIFSLEKFLWKRQFFGGFFQDDIRITPKLMLNLGMRWDFASVVRSDQVDGIKDNVFNRDGPFGQPGASLDNLSALYRPADQAWDNYNKMFSPRASFAYTLDDEGKTVIRGGAGIFFMPNNMFAGAIEVLSNGPQAPVELAAGELQVRSLGLQYGDTNETALSAAQSQSSISGSVVEPHRRPPYSLQYSLGIQREITPSTVFEIGYVGNHAVRTIYSPDWNRIIVNSGGLKLSETLGLANFSQNFRYYQNADSTGYHSMQASLKRRFADSFQYNFNYTYAWNFAHFRGDFTCCGRSENPQDQFNMRANRGPTSYHLRHRFTNDFFWELPGKNLAGAAKHIAGGWTVGGIVEFRSGFTLPVSSSTTANPGARPDILVSHAAAINNNWGTNQLQYLDSSAFALPPTDEFGVNLRPGTLSRRALYGPGFGNLDLVLQKNIFFKERQRLQFRIDFYNLFDTVNFTRVNTNARSSGLGLLNRVAPPRRVQLMFRYSF